jgi:N-acetylglucosamine kinase-like BadF-type ATPase
MSSNNAPLGLGLDAGGTQTRWALAGPDGAVRAEGAVAGFTALQLRQPEGVTTVVAVLRELATALAPHGQPAALYAGVTGFGGLQEQPGQDLQALLARALKLAPQAVHLCTDMELACRAVFAPGEGYLVYAGTGSIAGYVDAQGAFHRAGGRGGILDDGGGGYWIAREALRQVWRAEDERPGAWQESLMARALFSKLGGSDWALTRQLVYGAGRGELGLLALAVAESADQDPAAQAIVRSAGEELARLGRAMLQRYGLRPLALSGRAAHLHPLIAQTLRAQLPAGTDLRVLAHIDTHVAAARLALQHAN